LNYEPKNFFANIGLRPGLGVVAQRRAYSNSDANTEAIIFFCFQASRESVVEGRQRRDPRRSHGRGSQRANSCSKTDADAHAEIKKFAIWSAQIADIDTVESREVCHARQDAVPAKRNFAGSGGIAHVFRCE
jgi:hypothetical protein